MYSRDSGYYDLMIHNVERGCSVVECRTLNRESPGSNPIFATVSKFGHFRSFHDASELVSCTGTRLTARTGTGNRFSVWFFHK